MNHVEIKIGGDQENNFFPDKKTLAAKLEESPAKQAILEYLEANGINEDKFLVWPERRGLYLSDLGILRHFLVSNIVIHPFNIENLTPNSYDVTLGRFYYRQDHVNHDDVIYESPCHFAFAPKEELRKSLVARRIYNPWDDANVDYTWRLNEAVRAGDFMESHNVTLVGVQPDDEIIMLQPHEMILAHTEEFIGGRNVITTMISARSSVGRNLLEVCNDANLGHIGFVNRWTLEIKNKSDSVPIPLVVGQRYAQISFLETEPSAQSYQGQYQKEFDLEKIIASWNPSMLKPKMKRRGL